jgi:hypothetical protein
MSRWLLVAVGVLLLAVMSSPILAQQADPRMGTWKMNVAKSKYNPGPLPASQILKFESSNDGFKLTSDGVPVQGKPTHSEIVAKLDGRTYVVKGNPAGDISRMYKRVDAHTFESQDTFKGRPSFKRREVVSMDGKTMTVTVNGPNAQGVMTNNVVVYDKQ